jgi:hypothetical protein
VSHSTVDKIPSSEIVLKLVYCFLQVLQCSVVIKFLLYKLIFYYLLSYKTYNIRKKTLFSTIGIRHMERITALVILYATISFFRYKISISEPQISF